MREPFPVNPTLDFIPIASVQLDTDCRDELIPIMAGLQYLYTNTSSRDQLLALIAKDINGTTSALLGREGMSYWEIAVLAGVRLGCNLDYDKLQLLAHEHFTLRRIMGIGIWEDGRKECRRFNWKRIEANVCKLRPETVEKLNEFVVGVGHDLVPQAAEKVRGDSFVVETNIHYPTEANVLADGLRKVILLAAVIAGVLGLEGWRQQKHLLRRIKNYLRTINQECKSKRAGVVERRRQAYRPYLKLARKLLRRARDLVRQVQEESLGWVVGNVEVMGQVAELEKYLSLSERVAENARRRVMKGESVPNEEKIFSVFEPHTELINRGKSPNPIEFGRRTLLLEDSVGFIVHYEVCERGKTDQDRGVEALRRAQEKVGGKIKSASFDRGFHSPKNQVDFAEIVSNACIPVRGYKQAARQEAEATKDYKQSRRNHPGVESLINSVQVGNGLDRCRDRSERGLKRYVGLAVLGRNIQVLGRLVLA
jgi:hypothetical protein